MSIFLGPGVERWIPGTWQDLLEAAAGGLLDESQWVELKVAIPPGNRASNLELARDLASLAVDGGLLVVGIKDEQGRAGAVVGTQVERLADRIDQVSRDQISPPLIVRQLALLDPDRTGDGCMLVVVDAGADAPHMVDGKYWGRGATGKRVLTDIDVRNTMALNARRHADAAAELHQLAASNPLNSAGCIYVLAAPRSPRRGALADQIDDQQWVWNQLTNAAAGVNDEGGWWLTDERIHRTVDGIDVCHVEVEQFADRSADESGLTIRLLRIADTGRVSLAVNSLSGPAGDGNPQKLLWVDGASVLLLDTLRLAGQLADAAGYGGVWDVGVVLTDIRGAQEARSSRLGYGSRRSFPDDRYTRLVQTTSAALADPNSVVDELLAPLRRVLR